MKKLVLYSALLCSFHAYAESYKIGLFENNAPFVTKDDAGSLVGVDIDLWQAIAKDQNFEVEFFAHDFAETFENLENGNRDVIGGGYAITNERKEKYGVTDSYFTTKYAVATLDKSDLSITAENLRNYSVAVLENSIEAKILVDSFGVTRMVPGKTAFMNLKTLAQGKADVYFAPEMTLQYLSARHPQADLEIKAFAGSDVPVEEQGFLLQKSNTALLDKFNAGLRNIRANGKYDEILNKWSHPNK